MEEQEEEAILAKRQIAYEALFDPLNHLLLLDL
jgi:hypothetical protein